MSGGAKGPSITGLPQTSRRFANPERQVPGAHGCEHFLSFGIKTDLLALHRRYAVVRLDSSTWCPPLFLFCQNRVHINYLYRFSRKAKSAG